MRTFTLALASTVALIASPATAQAQPTNEAVKTETASSPAASTGPASVEPQSESPVKKPEVSTAPAPTAETHPNK